MDCTFINFNDKFYPIRTCTWERNGIKICADIGSTELEKMLLDASTLECDEYAELLDGDIMYYVDAEILTNTDSDEEILEYIIKNVDSDILDLFKSKE